MLGWGGGEAFFFCWVAEWKQGQETANNVIAHVGLIGGGSWRMARSERSAQVVVVLRADDAAG